MNIRADIIDVYVFRRQPRVEFLQLLRAGEPLAQTWQPVMGYIEAGETAVRCAERELYEELALARTGMLGFWALQEVHPYFLPPDSIMLSPRFATEVLPAWTPALNEEHTAYRWVPADGVDKAFLWPGQRSACREVLEVIIAAHPAAARQML